MRLNWSAESRWLALLLLAVTLFRLGLAVFLPITGDEAYFVLWADHPDYGYYDHPPMVGWWLTLLGYWGRSAWWVRLPALLLNLSIAIALYRALSPTGKQRAAWVSAWFAMMPVSWLNVLITTDTPMIAFGLLACWTYGRADVRGRSADYLLTGFWLGLAFLSKYFAALIGIAFAVHALLVRRDRQGWRGIWLVFVACLPAILLNLYWNYSHCWANLLFNLFNRNANDTPGWGNVQTYALMLLVLLTPWSIWYGLRAWRAGDWQPETDRSRRWLVLWLVPLGLFALLSWRKTIGLHWVLAFYPMVFYWLGLRLPLHWIRPMAKWGMALSLVLMVGLMVLLAQPLERWQKTKFYDSLVMNFHASQIVDEMRRIAPGYTLMAHNYSPAAVLSFYAGETLHVFGGGSHFARQDDFWMDFRQYDGRNMVFFQYTADLPPDLAGMFDRVEVHPLKIREYTFHLIKGTGFHAAAYERAILPGIVDRYYAVPAWLDCGRCVVTERYGLTRPRIEAKP